jgi:hypothetical protein
MALANGLITRSGGHNVYIWHEDRCASHAGRQCNCIPDICYSDDDRVTEIDGQGCGTPQCKC